jgi:predicted pyridoxine 5'-phosphate oxidase superfamily flavin-nucleotide-binding protein
MGTRQRTRKAQAVKAERVKGFRMIGVLEIDDRMRQLDRCYARLQFSGASREGKVVPVVALTGEVNSWR